MTETPTSPQPSRRRITTPSVAVFALIVIAAGAFALYEITHSGDKRVAHSGTCARSLDLAAAVDPLVHGEVAALAVAKAPRDLNAVAFDDAEGHKTTVASFAGKTILLNLWATWCVPCRTEMPALDQLQAQLGSKEFSVIPVNVDQLRVEKARGFFKETGATSLPYYSDTSADILRSLKSQGLPTTVLIGADGCEIGTMAGPAQWNSPEAKALIERAEKAAPRQS